MDIQSTNQQPISDDQELAKVLAGINQQADEVVIPPIEDALPVTPPIPPEPTAEEIAFVPPAPVPEPPVVDAASAAIPSIPGVPGSSAR